MMVVLPALTPLAHAASSSSVSVRSSVSEPTTQLALTSQLPEATGTAVSSTLATQPQIPDGSVSISIDSFSSEVLTGSENLTVTGTLANGTDSTLSNLSLVARMQRSTDITIDSLTSWLQGNRDGSLSTVATHELNVSLSPGSTAQFSFTINTDDMPLWSDSQWGPRGLDITLTSGYDSVATHRTLVIWNPGVTVDSTRMTVVVPVVASAAELKAITAGTEPAQESTPQTTAEPSQTPTSQASTTTQGTSADNSQDTDATIDSLTQRITALLSLGRSGVVFAVDPALLTALGLPTTTTTATPTASPTASAEPSSTATPETETPIPTPSATPTAQPTQASTQETPAAASAINSTQLQALRKALSQANTASDIIALPWADADINALAHLGDSSILTQAYQRTLGAATGLFGSDASITSTALATGPLDQATLQALPSQITTIIASAGDLPVTDNLTYTPSGYWTVDGKTILIPDAALSSAINGTLSSQVVTDTDTSTPSSATPSLSDLDARQLERAESAIITRQAPNLGRNMVISIDRSTTLNTSPAVLGARIAALLDSPWTQAQSLTSLTDAASADTDQAQRGELPATLTLKDEVTGAQVDRATSTTAYLTSIGSILSDPTAILGELSDIIAVTTSTAWRWDPTGRDAYLDQAGQAGQDVLSALSVVPSSTINVISSSADLPLRIQSSLDQDATVHIHLSSSSPRLQSHENVTVTVPAHGEVTATVPIKAVGSGDVNARIELQAADGTAVGKPFTLHTRVRADWESRGTRFIAAALCLLLIAGIVRTVRRGRRTVIIDHPDDPTQDTSAQLGSDPHDPGDPPTDTLPSHTTLDESPQSVRDRQEQA